jgi:hypothetical protein
VPVDVVAGCVGTTELDAAVVGADELGADELGADELGADELGADELGTDELGADGLCPDEQAVRIVAATIPGTAVRVACLMAPPRNTNSKRLAGRFSCASIPAR